MKNTYKLVILILIILNITTTILTTTKKSNKQKQNLTQCYESVEGKLYGINYNNKLRAVYCKTNCVSVQVKDGLEIRESNECDINSQLCIDKTVFVVKYNHTFKSSCCNTNLCNTPEYHFKNLNQNNCEQNKILSKNMSLIYKVRDLQAKSVSQCYSCQNCTKESEFKILKCIRELPGYKNYACQVKNKILFIITITFCYYKKVFKCLIKIKM